MAQLVARLVRNEKVRGSNPLSSTTQICLLTWALARVSTNPLVLSAVVGITFAPHSLPLDRRRRVQQTTRGRRGRKNDPLYRARRTLHTGADLLTDKQAARLTALFTIDEHVEVEATWGASTSG
ncbi:MAG: family transposase [Propionibacteriaceae bacterium]|nr:family transposase [Propionibacteriaceae bacterium]